MWTWYTMRATGVVLVALLTLSTVMGVLSTVRAGSVRWPRFATQTLHRNVSLLASAMMVVHAISSVIHEFVDVRWYDIFVPIGGAYTAKERPAMALGSLAFDLTVAVIITSLLRSRLPHRSWRIIHLFSYVAWLAGLVHGFLIGTDQGTWWALGVTGLSALAVAIAAVIRIWTAVHEVRRDADDFEGMRTR